MIRALAHRLVSRVRAVVPAPLWNRMTRPYAELLYRRSVRASWREREDAHVDMYWASLDSESRSSLIGALATLVEEHPPERPLRVLEFGCHAGMNFRRLHDRFADRPVSYFGVELNHDAITFARERLPFVDLLEADDAAFVRSGFPGRVDIAFVNVVFYSVESARAKRVIDRLCAISDVVVLGEQLANTGTTTQFRRSPEMYAHPYAHWLRRAGLADQIVVASAETSPQLSGFLIARRR